MITRDTHTHSFVSATSAESISRYLYWTTTSSGRTAERNLSLNANMSETNVVPRLKQNREWLLLSCVGASVFSFRGESSWKRTTTPASSELSSVQRQPILVRKILKIRYKGYISKKNLNYWKILVFIVLGSKKYCRTRWSNC